MEKNSTEIHTTDSTPISENFPLQPEDLDRVFSRLEESPRIPSEFAPKTLGESSVDEVEGQGQEKLKTSLRLRYEAEVEVIRKKLGGLEKVRLELGLTRRKMCQLLMVDPSAWTRWTRDETKVPPHVYRALQWYLALIEKQPEWHPQNAYLGAFKPESSVVPQVKEIEQRLSDRIERLKRSEQEDQEHLEDRLTRIKFEVTNAIQQMQNRTEVQVGWKILLILNTILVFYLIFR